MSSNYIGDTDLDFHCKSCDAEVTTVVEESKGKLELTCPECNSLNVFSFEIIQRDPEIVIKDHTFKAVEEVVEDIEKILDTPLIFTYGSAVAPEEVFSDYWEGLGEEEQGNFTNPHFFLCESYSLLGFLHRQYRDRIKFIGNVVDKLEEYAETSIVVGFKDGTVLEFNEVWDSRKRVTFFSYKDANASSSNNQKDIEKTAEIYKLKQYSLEIREGKREPDEEYYKLLAKVS